MKQAWLYFLRLSKTRYTRKQSMKRTIFLLFIFIVAFVLGVTIFIWLRHHKSPNEQNTTAPSINQQTDVFADLPILTYCELANNPEKYDGKIVRLHTKLYVHFHGLKFLDKNCYAEEKESAVIFNPEHEDEIFNKIEKDTKTERWVNWNAMDITVIGKFTRVKPTRRSDSMADNTYLHFEIIKVESASKQ